MSNPFQVVRDFESALCEYTGAPFAVTTTSCTMALLLAVAWWKQHDEYFGQGEYERETGWPVIEIPKHTYVSVPQSILHAGYKVKFRDSSWRGMYQLSPLPVWDSARWFTGGIYGPEANMWGQMVCLSFHWSKTLGIQQGGAILHDNPEADKWLRRARFDGRTEGVAPKDDEIMLGWHCYMAPETAAAGLVRLTNLPRNNNPLPNDAYPDLSAMAVFK